MNFLVDNNLSPSLAIELKNLGYDSIHVRERGMSKSSDNEIFNFALENNRIIVSADTDFGYILSQWDQKLPSINLFRNFSTKPAKQFLRLSEMISQFRDE